MEEHITELLSWLLFIYRVPQDPPGRRTYVWRRLKDLGAAYLQQAAAILPDDPARRQALAALQARIATYGGEASLLETHSPSARWEEETIARFNQARDAEYAELYESVERLEDEMARESRRGKFTFAELEDLESDWDKLGRWRERIAARDFFGAPGRLATDVVLDRARASLDEFTSRVYAQPHTLDDHELPVSPAVSRAAAQEMSEETQ
jgi:cell division protein FtsB